LRRDIFHERYNVASYVGILLEMPAATDRVLQDVWKHLRDLLTKSDIYVIIFRHFTYNAFENSYIEVYKLYYSGINTGLSIRILFKVRYVVP